MSRIRTTLDSVSKAVGSKDLLSKISRLKPGGSAAGSVHAEKVVVEAEPLAASETAPATTATANCQNTMKPPEHKEKKVAEEVDVETQQQHVPEKPFVATKQAKPSLASAAAASAASSSSNVAKQTIQLFHPTALSANMDETYNTLAQHINSYFGIGTHTQVEDGNNRPQQPSGEEKARAPKPVFGQGPPSTGDHIPILAPVAETKSIDAATPTPPPTPEVVSPPIGMPSPDSPSTDTMVSSAPKPDTSPKKGFTHYLSYPRPSVQAFVGNYITPLVPKFMGESKSIAAEKDKSLLSATAEEAGVAKAREKMESDDEKEEEKAKRLLTQREKVGRSAKALIKVGYQSIIRIHTCYLYGL